MQAQTVKAWQTVVGVVWVTLGVIPLVMAPFGKSHIVWGRVLGADPGAWAWIAPAAVVLVGIVALVALDARKS